MPVPFVPLYTARAHAVIKEDGEGNKPPAGACQYCAAHSITTRVLMRDFRPCCSTAVGSGLYAEWQEPTNCSCYIVVHRPASAGSNAAQGRGVANAGVGVHEGVLGQVNARGR